MKTIWTLVTLILISVSCGKKDQISPAFAPKTLKEQGFDHLTFTMGMEEEIESTTRAAQEIPVVGGIAGNLMQALANTTIERREGVTLAIAPQVVDLPELKQIDTRYIESIEIEDVQIEIPQEVRREAGRIREAARGQGEAPSLLLEDKLDFIHKIEVYLEPVEELAESERALSAQEMRMNWGDSLLESLSSSSIKVLEYDSKQDSVSCSGGCLHLRAAPTDLSQYLPRFGIFKVHTKIVLKSIPQGKLKVKGKVKFRININPPF